MNHVSPWASRVSKTNSAARKVNRKVTTYQTIILDRACKAVKVYNEGLYGCVKNPDLDKRAHDMFADGLGSTLDEIERQVAFI